MQAGSQERACVICGVGIEHRHSRAKLCFSCRDSAKRAAHKKAAKKYRLSHLEETRSKSRIATREYYLKHPAKKREARARYKASNPENVRELKRLSSARSRRNNPEGTRLSQARYAAKQMAALKLIREIEAKGLEALL